MSTFWGAKFWYQPERIQGVGESPLWILNKLATISARLDPKIDVDKVMKKVRFLYYDLATYLDETTHSDLDKISLVRKFLFENKAFDCRLPHAPAHEDDYLIDRVLARRFGSPLTIGLLFRSLAHSIHIPLELVVHEHLRLMKFVEDGKARFLDLSQRGKFLSSQELIDLFNGQLRETNALETLESEKILFKYLAALKKAYTQSGESAKLIEVLNLMMEAQPTNLKILAERALLKDQLNQPYEALLDLKRYFSFYNEHQAATELVAKFHQLRSQFDGHSAMRPPWK